MTSLWYTNFLSLASFSNHWQCLLLLPDAVCHEQKVQFDMHRKYFFAHINLAATVTVIHLVITMCCRSNMFCRYWERVSVYIIQDCFLCWKKPLRYFLAKDCWRFVMWLKHHYISFHDNKSSIQYTLRCWTQLTA